MCKVDIDMYSVDSSSLAFARVAGYTREHPRAFPRAVLPTEEEDIDLMTAAGKIFSRMQFAPPRLAPGEMLTLTQRAH
jgi:hypothetical protein